MNYKKQIKDYLIRPFLEKLNVDKYSRPSLNNLDRKLEKYLDFDYGTFLEIGANDGFKQSNTYYYERLRHWSGVLIEPVPKLFEQCKKLRKRSEVFNYICGSPKDSGRNKIIKYAGLMSQVTGSLENKKSEDAHIKRALENQKIDKSFEIEVKCLSLSEVIDRSNFDYFDFMSIDVEGYELQVLKGLDLDRHAPKYLLVETWTHEKDEIIDYLKTRFTIEDYLTHKDILFKKR